MHKFNPERAAIPDTDFRNKNSANQFIECGRFRPCANLMLVPAVLPDATLYLPTCTKDRFSRQGIARQIEMPVPSHRLRNITYATLGRWAPLISCPRKCPEYSNRTLARVKKAASSALSWVASYVLKPPEIWWAAFWAWVMTRLG